MLYCKKTARLSHTVLLLQLIPARGRKHIINNVILCMNSCNLSPRGDGNIQPCIFGRLHSVATYPREGTETVAVFAIKNQIVVATYPREGTETHHRSILPEKYSLQLIPARGRKLKIHHDIIPPIFSSCNLSPRGDGNSRCSRIFRSAQCCNLSPRGDGNSTIAAVFFSQYEALQLIPARGRKPAPSFPARRIQTLQLIPARGRKHRVRSHHGEIAAVATYPREGTETGCSIPSQSHCSRCNLSPRGDRNLLSLEDKIGYNEATGISPKRRNTYTDLCENFPYLPR